MNLIFTPAYSPFFAWSNHSYYYQILYVPFTTTKFLFPSLTDYKVLTKSILLGTFWQKLMMLRSSKGKLSVWVMI